ncbi:hypothetical protein [Sulfuracidifex tepidarius]|uniref:hypothetical protein n=1 Tax=Sulfuracidifex tepidarius TaxID=1294262 RepID=UPI0006D16BAE|nr:hypothetical protein [Sulfuracidifex tepidarius]
MARIGKGTFMIELRQLGDYNVYLVEDKDGDFILIDSGNGSAINYIINSIMTLLGDKKRLKYFILLSNDEREAGGANVIYNVFTPIIISHSLIAKMVRSGKGMNGEIPPAPVNMEIRDKSYELENELTLKLAYHLASPHIIAATKDIVFSGTITDVSPLPRKTLCTIETCIKG